MYVLYFLHSRTSSLGRGGERGDHGDSSGGVTKKETVVDAAKARALGFELWCKVRCLERKLWKRKTAVVDDDISIHLVCFVSSPPLLCQGVDN